MPAGRDGLKPIAEMDGWASPLLGIRFDCSGPELKIEYPDGRPFLTFTELGIREIEKAPAERDALAQSTTPPSRSATPSRQSETASGSELRSSRPAARAWPGSPGVT